MDVLNAIVEGFKKAMPAFGSSLQQLIPVILLLVVGVVVLEGVVYFLLDKVFKSKHALPYTLLAPSALGLAVFLAWPLLFNIIIAFSDWKLNTFLKYKDWGLGSFGTLFTLQYGWNNFQRVFSEPLLTTPESTFWIIFARTILWTVVNLVFHVSGGMVLALLLNRQLKVFGVDVRGLYRTVLIIPWAVPQVVSALVWRGEFNAQFGFVNLMLAKIGIQGPQWLSDPIWGFVMVCLVNIWLGIPFMTVIILGGLQSIAGEYFEAAEMDGASWWQQFRNITLPLLQPVLGPAITLGTIWTFNQLTIIFLMTQGAGVTEKIDILVTALYTAAFSYSKYGFGSMFSIVIFVILSFIAYAWLRTSGALKGVTEA
jgi:arabinogalactan oligomer/maltooligosaccharide transport system permease protein